MATITNSINNTVGGSNSGETNTLTLQNPSNTASTNARVLITVGGATAGDAYIQWSVSGVTNFVMGIDNSDSDRTKISRSTALGTTDVAYFDSTGMVLPSGMGATFLTSSGGSGTASTTNTLSVYEEGTWTPTVQSSNNNMTGISYVAQVGYYKIMGSLVLSLHSCNWNATGAGTGSQIINNLPFTSTNTIDVPGYANSVDYTWSAVSAARTNFAPLVTLNSTRVRTVCYGSATTYASNGTDIVSAHWVQTVQYIK
jgi:hypothetical protein